jgi:hypothetical protein
MTTAEAPVSRKLMLRRGAMLLLALVLGWQVITLQMSNHYANQAATGVPDAVDSALWWDGEQPRALELKARFLLREAGEEPDEATRLQARQLLELATVADPARGNVPAMLALLETGAPEADDRAALADRLAPVEPRVQRNLASYALLTENLRQAVIHIARAMVGDRSSQERYFPLLMRIAADPEAREVLAAIATDPTPFPWWSSFFNHVARNAEDLDALRNLVALREASTALPMQEYERNLYINRLRKEGLLAEAYLHWVNGLNKEQLGTLGYLYDGSFEHEFDNDSGFGWVARPPRKSGIRIARGDTYGVSGDSALRVSFRGKRVRFAHVYQQLFLPPGQYRVSGRARPDKIKARRGLQWRVYCSTGAKGSLGESGLFVGTGDWRPFDFTVTVPPECSGQILRLYSAGNREVDHEVQGTIWFDDMQIGLIK